jgi:hypothetical protein
MLQFLGHLWRLSHYTAQLYSTATIHHLHSTGTVTYLVRSPIQPQFLIDDSWHTLAALARHRLRTTNDKSAKERYLHRCNC